MGRPIKVIQYGLGKMGSQMARTVLEKADLKLVGAIVYLPQDAGKDVAELVGLKKRTGVITATRPEEVFRRTPADIVLHATVSYVPMVWKQIKPAVLAGLDVVTIAEEMGYPFHTYPKLARTMDRTARQFGVTIVGSGINPGFAMDILPLFLSGICHKVRRIRVTRLVNFAPFGSAIQKNIGIGMRFKEFTGGVKSGKLPLHIGLPESAYAIASGLHWKIDRIQQTRQSILTKQRLHLPQYQDIEKGHVCGFDQSCFAYEKGKLRIVLKELGRVDPNLQYQNTVSIEGTPNITETMNVPMGNLTTTAHAVNLIPAVLKAAPGLLSMKDLLIAPSLPLRS